MRRRVQIALLACLCSGGSWAGTITFTFGVGFNDPSPVSPVGGNNGTTLGDQRQILFQAAGQIWADMIDSPITIVVDANFDDLQCSANSAVLGSAGASGNALNPGLMPNILYPRSLEDALVGADQDVGMPDIDATFNINIDTGTCAGFAGFYYGLDNNAPNDRPALFATVLHEIAHGLGFSAFVNPDGSYPVFNNQELFGIFDVSIYDVDDDEFLINLSQPERAASVLDDPNLIWVGPNVTANFAAFTTGAGNGGNMRLYAPNPFEGGSSVSHWTTDATPDLLMEPELGNLAVGETDLTPFLFRDLGYTILIGPQPLIFASSFEDGE